jgi:tight adherence protein B
VTGVVALVLAAVLLWPSPPAGTTDDASPVRGPDGRPATPDRTRGPRGRRARRVGWPGSRRREAEGWVADLAEVAAVGLDAGLDLPRAVLAAAGTPVVAHADPGLRRRVEVAVSTGGSVAACLVGEAVRSRGDLEVLSRAWRLTEEVGAAASATTTAAAAAVRARQLERARTEALVAGPRASMWLLTVLPLTGPVIGLLVGIGPARLYGSPSARVSAVVGLVLASLGWLWAGRLLRRARRPGRTAGRPR